jgi:NAD(P)-dependent dehydrogenase (short-subunit alcohol dehydrogenase family)
MGRLDGKVAVITGSSGGIGGATAQRFVAEGAVVVGVDVAGEADYNVDVTDEDAVRDLYASVRERYGRIDVLFNNAGISPDDDASALETGLDAWRRVQDVNLTSVFLCCKHGIPHLLETGGGSVINTASFVAVVGAATSQISYTASKGGVLALSRELGVEFAKRGVRVNALCPGWTATDLNRTLWENEQVYAGLTATIPMGRWAKAEEMAGPAVFLASDASSFMTGQTLVVDGGQTAV